MKGSLFLIIMMASLAGSTPPGHIDLSRAVDLSPIGSKAFSLSQLRGNKASVIVFFSPECPICINMTKSVREMADSFAHRGVAFYLVYPGDRFSMDEIRRFQKDYLLLRVPAYRDDHDRLARLIGATATPHAFVIDATGTVAYSGKIDNQFASIGKRRTVTTEYYVRDALEALLAHRPVPITKTEPVGCIINL